MELIRIDDYIDASEEIEYHLNNIQNICTKHVEIFEGNCFYEHSTFNRVINLIPKQMNHFSLGKNHNNILEIGFNAGHSCLIYLVSNKDSKITIFDICEHSYTQECFNYLDQNFPNRMKLIPGDSNKTVPEFHFKHNSEKFDLVHIDGCHKTSVANRDFFNCLMVASDKIIFDDTQDENLNKLFETYLDLELIEEVFLYRTSFYKHRIGRIK